MARGKWNIVASQSRTLRILNIRKKQFTKKFREACRRLWQTQADAEKLRGSLKMKTILEAQKAVENW